MTSNILFGMLNLKSLLGIAPQPKVLIEVVDGLVETIEATTSNIDFYVKGEGQPTSLSMISISHDEMQKKLQTDNEEEANG